MNFLDMRTVMVSYVVSSGIVLLVMGILWQQNRRQPGVAFWVADYILQFVGLLLVTLRGAIPDFFSMVVANVFIVGGTLLLFIGLERFAERPSPQRFNYLILVAFTGIHAYFTLVQPSLQARNINLSVGMAVFCLQSAWLVFRRADGEMRRTLQMAGIVLAVIGGLSLLRVPVESALPANSDLFASGLFIGLLLLTFQILYILLTFALALAVNRRLQIDLQNDLTALDQANTATRRSEDLFAKVFRTSPYAITITHVADGRIIDVNDTFVTMCGIARAEALASTTIDLNIWVDPADRARLITALRSGKPVVNWEMPFRRKNGEVFIGAISSQIIEFSDTPAILSSIEDITARKQSEQALRESEERLDLVMEGSQLGFWDWNIETGAVHRNELWAQMLGYTLEEIAFSVRQWTDLHHPDDREGAWRSIQDHLEGRTPAHRAEYRMLAKDGSYRWILDQARVVKRDAQGKPLRMSGTHTDITERKQVEEALRTSQAETQTLLDAIPDLMFELDHDGRVLSYHNPTDETLYAPPAAFLDKTVTEVLPPSAATIVMAALAEADRQGWHRGATYTLEVAGDERWYELNIQTQHGAPSAAKRFVALVRDVSERERHAAELARARDAAEAANRAKSQFLAHMSHELRTPLNAILGFSELMADNENLTPAQQENLAIINRSGDHLLSTINDVLDIAKVEAGRVTIDARDFDLFRLLDELEGLFRLRAQTKGLALHVERAPSTPRFVHADAGKLRQILVNLLGNALKFTDAGGVTLSVRATASDDALPGWRLHFVIDDTGIGIDAADVAMIFDPFVQGAIGKAKPEGTGLGLPISREYARLLGGDLTVTSDGIPGLGSRFVVEIAAAPAIDENEIAAAANPYQVTRLAPGQPAYRLMVAEDNAANSKLLVDLLMGLGFDVRAVKNGAEAVDVWQRWQPHLIWMDINMPVMDGKEAARIIKQMAGENSPMIVAVSADVLSEERAAMLAAGCDEFLRKPYREDEIVACLVRRLGVHFDRVAASTGDTATVTAPSGQSAQAKLDVTDLGREWVTHLRHAALAADSAMILRLANEVTEERAALAAALREWADKYDYQAILLVTDEPLVR